MFDRYISRSKSLELIEEESSEDGVAHKVTFRVTDLHAWNTQLIQILEFADTEEDYVLSIRKEYFLREGKPAFVWNMMVWGDYASAAQDLGPFLLVTPAKKQGRMKTAKTTELVVDPTSTGRRSIMSVRKHVTDEGKEWTSKKVRLPHRRGGRDDPGTTKKMGDKRRGAFVRVASGAS